MPNRDHLLKTYFVTTATGVRSWRAEDADHAREQHVDAFGDDEDEQITGIVCAMCTLCNLHPGHPRGNGCEDLCDVCFARWEALDYPNEMDSPHDLLVKRLRAAADAAGCTVVVAEVGLFVGASNHPHGLGLFVYPDPEDNDYCVDCLDIGMGDLITGDAELVCAFIKENV